MEAKNEDSNASDEDYHEYHSNSSYNSIPSSSLLNMECTYLTRVMKGKSNSKCINSDS